MQPKKIKIDPNVTNTHEESFGDIHFNQAGNTLTKERYNYYPVPTLSKSSRVRRNVFKV